MTVGIAHLGVTTCGRLGYFSGEVVPTLAEVAGVIIFCVGRVSTL